MRRQIFSQVYKHFWTMMTWPGEIANILVYPFIGLISLGLFGSFVIEGGSASSAFVFIIYGVLAWNLYSTAQQTVTKGVLFELWNGSLKTFLSSRIRSRERFLYRCCPPALLQKIFLGNIFGGLFSSHTLRISCVTLGLHSSSQEV